MKSLNKKSDGSAKRAYKKYLEEIGYENVRITRIPTDIRAEKNGEVYYFEIKMTKQTDVYFGAATMTEWKEAIKNPNNFKFIIAITDDNELDFKFLEYTPEEFLKYSTIPPFKVNFNINLKNKGFTPTRKSAMHVSKEILERFIYFFDNFKS